MAMALYLPVEDIQDTQTQFLDILQPPGSSHTALSIHEAILQPTQAVWHTQTSCAPTPKRAERHYFIPSNGTDFLFSHPPLDCLVIQAETEHAHQHHFNSTPPD
ncbi:hypothetical protein KIL84_013735 [Mauremys mutica]|uniref:Uncharacterized protein n=1 Tax=Mauremys mutica TaxID=74926 RepID=A0A9D3WY71_9SAUR|nr:hypothetical protein KIL84_013735 [Mauremys mutica]